MKEKQTAVEWLIQQWPILTAQIPERIIDQAKEMEKEQIVNAVDGFPLDKRHLNGEEYYEQTYGGQSKRFYCLNQSVFGGGRKCEKQCLSCEKNIHKQ